MNKLWYVCSGLYVITLFSCATVAPIKIDGRNPYPNMTIVTTENNSAYEFRNEDSEKLVIYIEGTGWNSVLGWKNNRNNHWGNVGLAYFFVNKIGGNYTVLIPERLNMQIGVNYYYNPEMRRKYTLENLVESYAATINAYLSTHVYSSVILMGTSEGACLLPLIYKNITPNDVVDSMVAIAYGGLSVYEQVKILAESKLEMSDSYREACRNIEVLRQDVELYPASLGEAMGYTYGWWHSFMDYRPIDDYVNINIPILFIHGKLDIIVPVESTQYIQEHLPNKPFTYIYYEDMTHYLGDGNEKNRERMFKGIINWINEK